MKSIIIPLGGWAAGERSFRFHADTEFFQAFDNTEILNADVEVEIRVVKDGEKAEAYIHLCGTVTVPCDRCLEPLQVPVEEDPSEEFQTELLKEDWDLSQAVYDYVCLSLPMQRVHPEGECNPDTLRFLGQDGRVDEEAAASSPFAALKGLFESK